MVRKTLEVTYRAARRIVIAVIGGTVVALGVAMLVLPGPAFVVIPLGLAILSIEFAWAKRWLHAVKAHAGAAASRLRRNGAAPQGDAAAGRDVA
jgi:tellurite resistance protein TerC